MPGVHKRVQSAVSKSKIRLWRGGPAAPLTRNVMGDIHEQVFVKSVASLPRRSPTGRRRGVFSRARPHIHSTFTGRKMRPALGWLVVFHLSTTQRNPIVEQRSRPGHISSIFTARLQRIGPPAVYQPEPFARKYEPPRIRQ